MRTSLQSPRSGLQALCGSGASQKRRNFRIRRPPGRPGLAQEFRRIYRTRGIPSDTVIASNLARIPARLMSHQEQKSRKTRLTLSRKEIVRPLALFAGVLAGYFATIAVMLASPVAISFAVVPVCAIFTGLLFVIAHDACHQSFTSSRRLNHVIGRIAFLPALTSYSLWDHEHNRRHHRFNNVRHFDFDFAPMDAEEFAEASPSLRRWYSFSRSAVGVPFHWIYESWFKRLIFPRASVLGTIHFAHGADAALLWGLLAGYAALLAFVGAAFGKGILVSVALGIVLPFLILSLSISVVIFVHHTHFLVPWYASVEQWRENRGAICGTVHVKLPTLGRKLSLNIMVHNAHHYAPGVPMYHLREMQQELAAPGIVRWRWSLSAYREVCARCKLFDFAASRWTDFAAVATSGTLIRKAPASALAL
jgi:acyl-lipid omega-6 desaturase (Delta-12 desaturase)